MELFSRNIKFWGKKKQTLLKKSAILIAGVGGLGCTVAENLVRAGIGKLILTDNDEVEISNLNRQILYAQQDIGKSKVEVAKYKLKAINPDLEVEVFQKDVSELANLHLPHFNGIADCLDNYESRFILNDALEDDQFLVHGGVKDDFGQITTIKNGITQNLRQIYGDYKDDIEPGIIPQTVITIGSLMAHEIINNLFGKPQLLNKLLIVELSDFSMFKVDMNND